MFARGPRDKMFSTIRLIGRAIKLGSKHLPIRNHAAALATRAAPKDYLGQVREVYNDTITRWRYVNDPFGTELLSYSPDVLANLVLALDGVGVGLGKGAGDCDCVTAALGAELMAIGRPIRIGVTAPEGAPAGPGFSHVFIQAQIPKLGWITVDPVLHPHQKFGAITPHSRFALFNLEGQMLGFYGNYRR